MHLTLLLVAPCVPCFVRYRTESELLPLNKMISRQLPRHMPVPSEPLPTHPMQSRDEVFALDQHRKNLGVPMFISI
jgi:hypothetical protein